MLALAKGMLAWRVLNRTSVLCAAAILFLSRGSGSCIGFEFSGTLLIDGYRQVKGFPPSISGYFTVRSSDCKWRVWSKRFDQVNDYDEDSYDGTNLFTISCIASWVDQQKKRGLVVGENVGEAIITPGPAPENSTELNRILWLTFASSCYLKSNVTGQLPAIASHSDRHAYLYGFQQKAHWSVAQAAPYLPNSVIIYDSGKISTWADKDAGFMTGPPIEKAWKGPYANGFTNAVLKLAEPSTDRGDGLPRNATYHFNIYGPKPAGDANTDLALLRRYTFVITNTSKLVSGVDFTPAIPGLLTVTDQRFEKSSPPVFQVLYGLHDRWLTREEVQRSTQFADAQRLQGPRMFASRAAAAQQAVGTPGRNKRRYVVIVALTLTSITTAVLLVRHKLRQTQKIEHL